MTRETLIRCMVIGLLCANIFGCTGFDVSTNEASPQLKEDNSLPPYQCIKENLKTTDVTVAVELTKVMQDQVYRSDDGEPGYVSYQIVARVFESYKGNLKPGDKVVYFRLQEAGSKHLMDGKQFIASLNKANGKFVVPDVAYEFSYSEELHEQYRNAVNGH